VDELIRQAIAGRRVVAFRYRGQRRVGEPHLFGRTNGRAHLLVYQTGGTSFSGPYPSWRRCDLTQISHFVVTSRTFQAIRLGASYEYGGWDEIWAIASE
jgi:hypothetical protein